MDTKNEIDCSVVVTKQQQNWSFFSIQRTVMCIMVLANNSVWWKLHFPFNILCSGEGALCLRDWFCANFGSWKRVLHSQAKPRFIVPMEWKFKKSFIADPRMPIAFDTESLRFL